MTKFMLSWFFILKSCRLYPGIGWQSFKIRASKFGHLPKLQIFYHLYQFLLGHGFDNKIGNRSDGLGPDNIIG